MEQKQRGQGNKTHEQFLREVERKDDVPKGREMEGIDDSARGVTRIPQAEDARPSEMPVSQGGMNQESRDHNKHNNPGQSGHRPQKHGPAEEKQ